MADTPDGPGDGTDKPGAAEALAAVRDALAEPWTLSLADVASAEGIDADVLGELFVATGRARERYGDRDLAYARALRQLLDLVPAELLQRAGRVRSRHLTSIVVNDLGVVRDGILGPLLASGTTVQEIGDQLAASAAELVPVIARLLALDYEDILVQLLETETVAEGARTAGQQVQLAVGFVDLVGFTQLSASVDPAGLGEVLTAFEDLVHGVARRREQVLIAKFIGDAAMLVSPDPDELARALYDLVSDRGGELAEIGRRAGIAHGAVVAREGDYFGATVNLAARLTDLARPHSVVAAAEMSASLGEGWDVSRLPPRKLRGVGSTRPLRLRWRPAEDG